MLILVLAANTAYADFPRLSSIIARDRYFHLFHNQRALLIKGALLFKPDTVVTSVPFHLLR
jgi:hypothetical protein